MVENLHTAPAEIENVLLMVVDLEGRILRFNPTCERLTGYAATEVLGRSLYDLLLPAEEVGLVQERLGRVVAGDFPNAGENAWVTRTGERRLISWWNTALTDDAGDVVQVVSSGIDVTEHHLALAEIQRQEERYRALVEQLPLIIYVDRLDELSSNVYTSPQVEQILGYTAEEWAERPELFVEMLHPEDRERVLEQHARVRATGEPLDSEYRLVSRDGTVVWLHDEGIVLRSDDGQPRFLQGYLLDVTAQKQNEAERTRLEEQLRQSQKMEAVGRLAGGIAHDFNNLLTAIQGYSELALSRLEPNDPHRHEIDEIHRAADRAAQLTRQLLAFGRRQVLQPKVLDLNDVVAGMESMLSRLIGEDIELVIALDPELGSVRADPNQIEQVLLNLAVNARDAMPLGGRLSVDTSNTIVPPGEVRERVPVKPGRYAVLSVSDTGEGMPAAVQERIFEPFFTTKDTGAGTGLGLATVYGIVKQSGGYIWVDSAPGRGSRFRMYLPLHGAVAERPPVEPRPAIRGGGETVLVAEDEDAVRTMVRRVLEDQGYTVLTAANGTEALEVARLHIDSVDLLVSDVVMPGMSGAALGAALHRLRPGLPVILMSGYAEPTASRESLDSASYLQKPFSPRVLAETVQDALAAAACRSEASAVSSAPPIAEAI